MNNSTNGSLPASRGDQLPIGDSVDGRSVKVEQGPRWLVELAMDPPTWLLVVLVAIVAAVVGLAALGYCRNGGLDQEVLEEMGQTGTIVLTIMACAEIWTHTFESSYVVDILGGTAVGYLIAQFFIWSYYRSREERLSVTES